MGLEPTTSPRGGAHELELIGIEVHSLRKGLDTRNHLRKNTAKDCVTSLHIQQPFKEIGVFILDSLIDMNKNNNHPT